METQGFVIQLQITQACFLRSTSCLTEQHAEFSPTKDTMTALQLVAHVADTVDWFMEGAFRPEGFDLNFEDMRERIKTAKSMAEARAWIDRAFENAIKVISSKTMAEMMASLPEGPIMGGDPTLAIISGIMDHTAHHRGALAVYSRLQGLTPPMPYADA